MADDRIVTVEDIAEMTRESNALLVLDQLRSIRDRIRNLEADRDRMQDEQAREARHREESDATLARINQELAQVKAELSAAIAKLEQLQGESK